MQDLRRVIEELEGRQEVVRISREVEPLFGIPGVIHELAKQPYPPVPFFENVAGYKGVRGCGLIFADKGRVCRAIGFPEDPIETKLRHLQAISNPIEPQTVDWGPCKENVVTSNIDLEKHLFPTRGALNVDHVYYQPQVITRDPRTGERNVAVYRSCIQGPDRVTVNMRPERHGGLQFTTAQEMNEPFPVAIIIGTHPALYLGAIAKLPYGYFEYGYAGALLGEPVKLVKCETIDLEVPAYAEFVIEGVIEPPYERGDDGPWPEYLKYLGMNIHPPVARVTAITYRNNPINYVTIPGVRDEVGVRFGHEAQLYKTLKEFAGDFVVDSCITSGSVNHHVVIKVKKRERLHEGLQLNVAMAAFYFSAGVEMVILVDEDIDIYDYEAIDWAILTRCDPTHQVHILPPGRTHQNIPIAGVKEMDGQSAVKGKMIIDATIPWNYRVKEKSPGVTYFTQSEWPNVDLREYLEDDDYRRWIPEGASS